MIASDDYFVYLFFLNEAYSIYSKMFAIISFMDMPFDSSCYPMMDTYLTDHLGCLLHR